MKKIYFIALISYAIITFSSCRKEASDPVISDITFTLKDAQQKDSLITEVKAGKSYSINAKTDADLCTLWPSDIRVTVKSIINSSADSLDIFGHTVLTSSNYYSDYGLLNAKGIAMTASQQSGYTVKYTYNTTGTYEMVIIATAHGISDSNEKTLIAKKSIVVK